MHSDSHYKGRFAPTPSGPLHFGSLVTALASWLDAHYHQGEWYLRIDDIDPPREQPGAADTICYQLDNFGLHWHKKIYQSQRHSAYQAAIEKLLAHQTAFYCRLSRRQLAARQYGHPGKIAAVVDDKDCAIRVIVDNQTRTYRDRFQPDYQVNLQTLGGAFVICRRDGLFAYHLACAVDDTEFGITSVIRGADLLTSTAQQQHIMRLLGQLPPSYGHTPLITAANDKLATSCGYTAINIQQSSALLYDALRCLGLAPPCSLTNATVTDILAWGIAHWPPDHPSASIDIHHLSTDT